MLETQVCNVVNPLTHPAPAGNVKTHNFFFCEGTIILAETNYFLTFYI